MKFYQLYNSSKEKTKTSNYVRDSIWFDIYNSSFLISNTQIPQIYHKSKLVVGVENIPYILSDVFEVILYAACAAAAIYLGDVEMEAKFDALSIRKIDMLNQKEIRASMKGASFSSQFSSPLL